jgi:hypothetical protein
VSTTLYTIGTALRRAHENGMQVALLVESHWLQGRVAGIDGHGVILDFEEDQEHSVVRLERISAVRIHGLLPAAATTMPGPAPDPARRVPGIATLQPV